MSKAKFVYSTLPAAQAYTSHKATGDEGLSIPERTVIIKGGASLADHRFETPLGVMTEITEDDFEFLKKNVVFMRHAQRGFIKVLDEKIDVEKVAADQNRASGDVPVTPQDFEAEDVKPPTHKHGNKR